MVFYQIQTQVLAMKQITTINRPGFRRSIVINWIILIIGLAVLFSLVLDLKGVIDVGWTRLLGIL